MQLPVYYLYYDLPNTKKKLKNVWLVHFRKYKVLSTQPDNKSLFAGYGFRLSSGTIKFVCPHHAK